MRTGTYGRADLHVHTLWSDGAQRPEVIVAVASERVDVVAITDHDEIRGALRAREWAREHPELGVDVVVGEEISSLNGHSLGLFLEERIPPGLSALDTIGEIHAQGGLAVAAHPFHPIRGVSRFEGRDAESLRRALLAGRTRAHGDWSWTVGKLPYHLAFQLRAAYKFLRRERQRVAAGTLP